MKNKLVIGIILMAVIAILTFIIPVKKETKEVWYSKDMVSYGSNVNFYYNIYGLKIWPFLSHYERTI